TLEKVRQALFNVLAQWGLPQGCRVLDLYAGSGALGIEALSRGAAHVTFVEADARAVAGIRANLKALGVAREQAQVLPVRVLAWLKRPAPEPVGLVTLDPPYAGDEAALLLQALPAWPGLAPGAVLVAEIAARHPSLPTGELEVLSSKRYGDTRLIFLRKGAS
ncbi:MAG TPA: RsmD family RNA methyltransferase, partial [bacterium]|nr:RsmD family RNA methyltransferase [bacterium]